MVSLLPQLCNCRVFDVLVKYALFSLVSAIGEKARVSKSCTTTKL